jgi:hypothetical protein
MKAKFASPEYASGLKSFADAYDRAVTDYQNRYDTVRSTAAGLVEQLKKRRDLLQEKLGARSSQQQIQVACRGY